MCGENETFCNFLRNFYERTLILKNTKLLWHITFEILLFNWVRMMGIKEVQITESENTNFVDQNFKGYDISLISHKNQISY